MKVYLAEMVIKASLDPNMPMHDQSDSSCPQVYRESAMWSLFQFCLALLLAVPLDALAQDSTSSSSAALLATLPSCAVCLGCTLSYRWLTDGCLAYLPCIWDREVYVCSDESDLCL